jgi:hypothetical protein
MVRKLLWLEEFQFRGLGLFYVRLDCAESRTLYQSIRASAGGLCRARMQEVSSYHLTKGKTPTRYM